MVSAAPGGVRHAPSGTVLPGTAAVSAAHSGGRALRLSAGMAEAEVRGKLGPVRKDGAQSVKKVEVQEALLPLKCRGGLLP